MRRFDAVLLLALATFPGAAAACAEPISPGFAEALSTATRVIAIRVESARIEHRPAAARRRQEVVVVDARVVDALKGDAGPRLTLEWSTYCQGLSVHVGGYYVVPTTSDGSSIDLTFAAGTVAELSHAQ